ncbi:MAG: hypothetical protein J0L92_32900 [Deltaproteobacteria bacterium]|nr:hypothetical protein [Deltaproteobacteria bacterium]
MRVGVVGVVSILLGACGRTAPEAPPPIDPCAPSELDLDGDCSPQPEDCDDGDPAVHPDAIDRPLYDRWALRTIPLDREARTVWMAVDARGCVELAAATPEDGTFLGRGSFDGFDVAPVLDVDARLSQIAFDPVGDLHGLVLRGESATEAFFASRDGAGSWREEPIGRAGGPGASALTLDASGDAHVLLAASEPSTNGVFWYGRRSQGWTLEEVSGFSQAYDTRLLVWNGVLHASWSTHWQTPHLHHAHRDDDGVWRRTEIDDQGDSFGKAGAAVDAAGTVHWAYRVAERNDPSASDLDHAELRYASTRGGRETIADMQPWCIQAAFGPDRLLYVLFIASDLGVGRSVGDVRLAVRQLDRWSVTTLARGEGETHIGPACALAVDALGVMHAAWTAGTTIRYARGLGAGDARDANCDGVDGIADPCAR